MSGRFAPGVADALDDPRREARMEQSEIRDYFYYQPNPAFNPDALPRVG